MRQIVLDTETTGLSAQHGHRIIEIGCVELVHRRLTGQTFHTYLKPERKVDEGAIRVHGLTNEFLQDKPLFKNIVNDFKQFIQGAELIIHNAPFDVSFIENELFLLKDKWQKLENYCEIFDTLVFARQKHPGQRNNLDALCKRYNIDNQHREKHGALLDAEILAEVYLAMTGGQDALSWEDRPIVNMNSIAVPNEKISKSITQTQTLFLQANANELAAHEAFLDLLEKLGTKAIWRSEVDD